MVTLVAPGLAENCSDRVEPARNTIDVSSVTGRFFAAMKVRFIFPVAEHTAGEGSDMVSMCCSPLPIDEVSSASVGVGSGGSTFWPVKA